jgi:hypothetical protein
MVSKKATRAHPDELTREEGWALLDRAARRYLDMSAEEFIRTWDANGFPNVDTPEVIRVVALLPLVR